MFKTAQKKRVRTFWLSSDITGEEGANETNKLAAFPWSVLAQRPRPPPKFGDKPHQAQPGSTPTGP